MPSNRKYRTRKIKQTSISQALRSYFETGSYDNFPEEDRCDVFLLSSWEADLKAAWDAVKDEILADWMQRHPCSKPFAWWRFDAPETRQESESEATYLDRHGLLTPQEKKYLMKM